MNRFIILPLGTACLMLGMEFNAPAVEANEKSAKKAGSGKAALVKGNNVFAFDLYSQLRSRREGNLFFSPYSISTALGMTYAGARGKTAEEMAKTLHFSLKPKRLHSAFKGLISDLNGDAGTRPYRLDVANALWTQKGYPFLRDFVKLVVVDYHAEANLVDFQQPDQARRVINAWVEKKTEDKIKELFKPNTVNKDTRLVLTNAIYFKGAWRYQFPKGATRKEVFRLGKEKTIKDVPLMHLTGKFSHYEGDSFQLLTMPYKGEELEMVVLLPKKVAGLAKFEKKLTAARLEDWRGRTRTQLVQITLPRLKVTSEFDLKKVLASMGMPRAFTRQADLSGMTQSKELQIQQVVHKAFAEVNEEGTEAAAATGVRGGKKKSARVPRRVIFRADHPFLFLIRHERSGSILFLGRVMNPGKS
jgi:serpin B